MQTTYWTATSSWLINLTFSFSRICHSSKLIFYKVHLTTRTKSWKKWESRKSKKKKKNVGWLCNSFKMLSRVNWMWWTFWVSILDSWPIAQPNKYLKYRKVWFLTRSDAIGLMGKSWLLPLIKTSGASFICS
jgi:hypothetical protein